MSDDQTSAKEWTWADHVLKTLQDHEATHKDLYEIHHACEHRTGISLAKLEVKCGLIGLIGGAIPAGIVLVIIFLRGHL